LEAN